MKLRDLPGDIRRRALRRGAIIIAVLAAVPIAIVWKQISEPVHLLETRQAKFTSDSALFKTLTFTGTYESFQRDDSTWLVQPKHMPLEVSFALANGTETSFTVEVPGLRTTLLSIGGGPARTVTLDAEELTAWMRSQLSPSGDDTTFQRDAGELMAFLKVFGPSAPTTPESFANWAGSQLKHFHPQGFVITGTFRQRPFDTLKVAVAFLAAALLALVSLLWLKRAAVRETVRQTVLDGAPKEAEQEINPTGDEISATNP